MDLLEKLPQFLPAGRRDGWRAVDLETEQSVSASKVGELEIHETSGGRDCRQCRTHAVLLRSCNPPNCPRQHIRIISIAAMIIDRASFILTRSSSSSLLPVARGLGITRFWAILGPILQIPADRQFTPAAPDCVRHWATGTCQHPAGIFLWSPSLPACEFASLPVSLPVCMPSGNLIIHCYYHLDNETKICALSTTEDSSTITTDHLLVHPCYRCHLDYL